MIFLAGYFISMLLLLFSSYSSLSSLLFYEYGCSCTFPNWQWHCFSILLLSLGLNVTYWLSSHNSIQICQTLLWELHMSVQVKKENSWFIIPYWQQKLLTYIWLDVIYWTDALIRFFIGLSTLKYIFGQTGKKN